MNNTIKRIVTYVKAIKPKSHLYLDRDTIIISNVTKEEFYNISNAVKDYINYYIPIRYEDVMEEDTAVLIDDQVLPYKLSTKYTKLSNNEDFVRYLLACKILWPSAKFYTDDQSLTDELKPDLIVDVPDMPKTSSLPVCKSLCNMPSDETFVDHVHTVIPFPNEPFDHKVDITNLLEVTRDA